jgi:hypothetical protein
MPCTHYKNALVEAAASGAEPQGELRVHLVGCADCRTAFALERVLFSSIDAGLHVTANAEVPASLLPRVRAELDEEVTPNRSWATNWLVLASAAAILAAFFVARVIRRPDVQQNQPATSAHTNPSAPVLPPAQGQPKTSELARINNSHSQPQDLISRNPQKRELRSARISMPEVLVPHDQGILLAEYAEQWHLRKRAPLVAQDSDATILAPLQVAQIQIAELDVKLLADEHAQ